MAEVVIDGVRYIPEPDETEPSLADTYERRIGDEAHQAETEDEARRAFEQWLPCAYMGTRCEARVEMRDGHYREQDVENLWRAWRAGRDFYNGVHDPWHESRPAIGKKS